jgi:hypothetical protein
MKPKTPGPEPYTRTADGYFLQGRELYPTAAIEVFWTRRGWVRALWLGKRQGDDEPRVDYGREIAFLDRDSLLRWPTYPREVPEKFKEA